MTDDRLVEEAATGDELVETTSTGIPIRDCGECGRRHPVTREHCPVCGRASLFCHHPRTEEGAGL